MVYNRGQHSRETGMLFKWYAGWEVHFGYLEFLDCDLYKLPVSYNWHLVMPCPTPGIEK